MAQDSKIEWTTHTFNPWRGCTKVSPGCKNCYAETLSVRNPKTLGVWGPNGTRVVAAESAWREPLKWDRAAKKAGERHRVFCASLADVFEDWQGPMTAADGRWIVKPHLDSESGPENWQLEFPETFKVDPQGWRLLTMGDVRKQLFNLIDATPCLDWLLLTKRPENITRMLPSAWTSDGKPGPLGPTELVGTVPHNVWLGTSVENQAAGDERIPHLLRTPAAVRFLSCEPLLSAVDLRPWLSQGWCPSCQLPCFLPGVNGPGLGCGGCGDTNARPLLSWVIVGGESGPGCRPCHPEWVRSLVKQCKAAGVPVFVKQMGGNVVTRNDMIEDGFNDGETGWPQPDVEHDIHGFREEHQGADCRIRLRDRKGGDPAEWPADLRVREFPRRTA